MLRKTRVVIMIADMSINKKRALVIGCIILSLLIHLMLLKMRIYTKYFVFPGSAQTTSTDFDRQQQLAQSLRPMFMTKQLPKNFKRAQQHALQLPTQATLPPTARAQAPTQQQLLTPPPTPVQNPTVTPEPEKTPSGHKIFRAGTSLTAPMTEHALAPSPEAHRPHAHHPAQKPEPSEPTTPGSAPQAEQPAQPAPSPGSAQMDLPSATQAQAPTSTPLQQERTPAQKIHAQESPTHKPGTESSGNRLTLTKFDPNGTVPIQEFSAQQFEQVSHSTTQPGSTGQVSYSRGQTQAAQSRATTKSTSKGLNFLSQENFEHMIREHMSEDGAQTGAEESDDHNAWYGSHVQNQYGDMRFLHYNRKIYQALQQSMSIVMGGISPAQYRAVMDGVRTPTRINFALDQNGQVISITIGHASGNLRYDNLAIKIVKEASYPTIPKSFELHTTYHHYGILLFDPGSDANIGVSPFLEGE